MSRGALSIVSVRPRGIESPSYTFFDCDTVLEILILSIVLPGNEEPRRVESTPRGLRYIVDKIIAIVMHTSGRFYPKIGVLGSMYSCYGYFVRTFRVEFKVNYWDYLSENRSFELLVKFY